MSLASLIKGKRGPSGFGHGSTAEEVTEGLDLSGKTILVTGINSGLGSETTRVLALRGAHIIGAARTLDKATAATDSIDGDTTPVACELSDLSSVVACADTVGDLGRPLDAIICNAGIMALPRLEQIEGIEKQFFTNHLGHFTLVTALLDKLADDGRVVMLSSSAHKSAPKVGIELDNLSGEQGYSAWRAYGQAKLANLLFAVDLARRFNSSNRTANAIHPGVIRTNLGRHMNAAARIGLAIAGPLFFKSVGQGAATSCFVAVHPAAAEITGEYLADCNIARSSARGRDTELAEKLWSISEEVVERVLDDAQGAQRTSV
jgi:WW domain-containing oxidoreductase